MQMTTAVCSRIDGTASGMRRVAKGYRFGESISPKPTAYRFGKFKDLIKASASGPPGREVYRGVARLGCGREPLQPRTSLPATLLNSW